MQITERELQAAHGDALGDFDMIPEPTEEELDEIDQEYVSKNEAEKGNMLAIDDALKDDDPYKLYLREVSAVPLLTAEEEVQLSKRIKRGEKARSKLAEGKDITDPHKLNEDIQDGFSAQKHLVSANTRLVISIAKKNMNRGISLPDLVQWGNIGVIRAAKKFDYRRGFKFSTYATWWIDQAIGRAIADYSRTIRIPVRLHGLIHLLFGLKEHLTAQAGRPPRMEELTEVFTEEVKKRKVIFRVTQKKVEDMLKNGRPPLSLSAPVYTHKDNDTDDSELGDFIQDEGFLSPPEAAFQGARRHAVEETIKTLSAREQRILRLRFGLEDGVFYTLEEVGEKFGVTRERIRQIEAKALHRLRHPTRARVLREYVRD